MCPRALTGSLFDSGIQRSTHNLIVGYIKSFRVDKTRAFIFPSKLTFASKSGAASSIRFLAKPPPESISQSPLTSTINTPPISLYPLSLRQRSARNEAAHL